MEGERKRRRGIAVDRDMVHKFPRIVVCVFVVSLHNDSLSSFSLGAAPLTGLSLGNDLLSLLIFSSMFMFCD